ncbi:hypothetical protein Pelo_6050 [Pelomyxa schiedti]|nr:hypothetical protein Pelo_6050 [Pelomyxa schiedti]
MWRSSQPATMLQFMVNATFTHWHRHPLKRVGRQFRFDPLNLLQEGAGYKELEEERCDLSHSYALSLWKLYHNEGKDAAAEKLHRSFSQHFKPNSKNFRVCTFLQHYCGKVLGGPKALSYLASDNLNEVITPRDISKGIFLLKLSKKVKSATPGLSVAVERYQYHLELKSVVWRAEQIVFTDEKTFDSGDITKRMGNYGYSPINERLPTTARLVHLPVPKYGQIEVIAAIGVAQPGPMLDGSVGDIGAIAFFFQKAAWTRKRKSSFIPVCYLVICPHILALTVLWY